MVSLHTNRRSNLFARPFPSCFVLGGKGDHVKFCCRFGKDENFHSPPVYCTRPFPKSYQWRKESTAFSIPITAGPIVTLFQCPYHSLHSATFLSCYTLLYTEAKYTYQGSETCNGSSHLWADKMEGYNIHKAAVFLCWSSSQPAKQNRGVFMVGIK